MAFTLVWLLAPVGARYFAKDPTTANWFAAYALVILANLIAESSTGLLQIFNRFRQFSVVSIISSLVTLTIIVIVTISHGGFAGILIAYITGKVFDAICLSILAIREASRRWGNQWWRTPIGLLRPHARQMVSFAINTNISASLSLITKDSELLWVALLRSPVDAGYYKVAMALANIVQLPISPLPQVTYPELSAKWHGRTGIMCATFYARAHSWREATAWQSRYS